MKIRLATKNDKPQVLMLLDEFSLHLSAKDMPSSVGNVMFDEVIAREDTKIFVAEENGQLFGLATFYMLPNIRHGWKRGHIEDFFITGSQRNKGIGTDLFLAIKEYSRKNNIQVIKLTSGNDLLEAHSFYEKNGGKTTEKFFRFDLSD